MGSRHLFLAICMSVAVLGSGTALQGQEFFTYTDNNGVQVLTNIPPVNGAEQTEPMPTEKTGVAKTGSANGISPPGSSAFDSIINKYAKHYRLDPSLIHSIIATESGFNPNAVSSKGARGLMQLMPATADRLGVLDSFDPEQNIRGGVEHFRALMDMFDNNLGLSLAAYNAGENLVQKIGRIPSYKETIHYVQTVTNRYRERQSRQPNREEDSDSFTYRYRDEAGVLHLTNIPPAH